MAKKPSIHPKSIIVFTLVKDAGLINSFPFTHAKKGLSVWGVGQKSECIEMEIGIPRKRKKNRTFWGLMVSNQPPPFWIKCYFFGFIYFPFVFYIMLLGWATGCYFERKCFAGALEFNPLLFVFFDWISVIILETTGYFRKGLFLALFNVGFPPFGRGGNGFSLTKIGSLFSIPFLVFCYLKKRKWKRMNITLVFAPLFYGTWFFLVFLDIGWRSLRAIQEIVIGCIHCPPPDIPVLLVLSGWFIFFLFLRVMLFRSLTLFFAFAGESKTGSLL